MSYQITHFGRSEWDRYLSFVRRLREEFGPTAEDLRHRWRVFQNPWDGYFMLAHTDTELAATLTLSARRLRTPAGEVLPCYELSHGWTHERHRRRGLFHRLGGYARDLVFSGTDVRLIIGAPNPSAEPNWRRHQYRFTEDDGARLVLVPRLCALLHRRILGARTEVRARQAAPGDQVELEFDGYAAATAALPRMNEPSAAYLRWRFRDTSDGYRFFRAGRSGAFLCALRVTHLGDLPVLVASECWLDGARAPGGAALRLVPRVAARFFRGHAGTYLHVPMPPPGPGRSLVALRHRALVHRPQPLCYLFRDGATAAEDRLMNELRRRSFQLSDCDVG